MIGDSMHVHVGWINPVTVSNDNKQKKKKLKSYRAEVKSSVNLLPHHKLPQTPLYLITSKLKMK